MKRAVAVAGVVLLLSGCASTPSQSSVAAYPTKGQTVDQQARDTSECTLWAKQQTGYDPATETGKGIAVGALIGAASGAALGAATGAVTGHAGSGAAIGAAAGGIGGGAIGGGYQYSRSKDGYDRAYSACMGGRGYSVR
jgi:hypothetical protein